MRRPTPLLAATLGLAALDVHATALSELMRQVPAPPTDVATALAWVKDGQIVTPEYTRFKQALEAERAAIAAANGGSFPAGGGAPNPNIADTVQVQNAVRGYATYLQANSGDADPAKLLRKRTGWLQAATGRQLETLTQHMKPCPEPCTDPAAQAQNAPLLTQRARLGEQDLSLFGTLFQDWQNKRGAAIAAAEGQLAPTGDGASATTPEGKAAIAAYRAALLKEVDLTLSVTELAVKRADVIAHMGTSLPDAVSGSTKNRKK